MTLSSLRIDQYPGYHFLLFKGLLYLEPSDNTEASGRISNTDDEIASVFYSRLRNYFVDDSICVSKEVRQPVHEKAIYLGFDQV